MPNIESSRWYYANDVSGFISDAQKDGYIADILEKYYIKEWGREPHLNLLRSWHASPPALAAALAKANMKDGQIVVLEYQIDTRNRLDAAILGYSKNVPNIVIVETKQWNEKHEIRECSEGEYVQMQFGDSWIAVEHPSIQARRYRERMRQVLESNKQSEEIEIAAYAYLHNCYELSGEQKEVLKEGKFNEVFRDIPIYTYKFAKALGYRIRNKTGQGRGMDVLKKLPGILSGTKEY